MTDLLQMDPALSGRVRIGTFTLAGVHVRDGDDALAAEVGATCADLRRVNTGVPSSAVPGVSEARALYKAMGIDPTKVRPSNEALLRRALKGEPLYRVNTLVDALNLTSLRQQLPYGLYDLDRVCPPVILRQGGEGEGYEGIRKGWINLGGRLLLSDAEGPFGNPSADSARTSISTQTTRALVVAFAPATIDRRRLEGLLEDMSATLRRFCGGNEADRRCP